MNDHALWYGAAGLAGGSLSLLLRFCRPQRSWDGEWARAITCFLAASGLVAGCIIIHDGLIPSAQLRTVSNADELRSHLVLGGFSVVVISLATLRQELSARPRRPSLRRRRRRSLVSRGE